MLNIRYQASDPRRQVSGVRIMRQTSKPQDEPRKGQLRIPKIGRRTTQSRPKTGTPHPEPRYLPSKSDRNSPILSENGETRPKTAMLWPSPMPPQNQTEPSPHSCPRTRQSLLTNSYLAYIWQIPQAGKYQVTYIWHQKRDTPSMKRGIATLVLGISGNRCHT